MSDMSEMCSDVHDAVCGFPDNADSCDHLPQCQQVSLPPQFVELLALPIQSTNEATATAVTPMNLQADDDCLQVNMSSPDGISAVLRCTVRLVKSQHQQLLSSMDTERQWFVGALSVAACAWLGMCFCHYVGMPNSSLKVSPGQADARGYHNMDSDDVSSSSVCNLLVLYGLPLLFALSTFGAGICLGLRWAASADASMMTNLEGWLQNEVQGDLDQLFQRDQLSGQISNTSAFGNMVYDVSTAIGMAARRSWFEFQV